jgi:hypothetical protein
MLIIPESRIRSGTALMYRLFCAGVGADVEVLFGATTQSHADGVRQVSLRNFDVAKVEHAVAGDDRGSSRPRGARRSVMRRNVLRPYKGERLGAEEDGFALEHFYRDEERDGGVHACGREDYGD